MIILVDGEARKGLGNSNANVNKFNAKGSSSTNVCTG